jgi:thioredoxin 1
MKILSLSILSFVSVAFADNSEVISHGAEVDITKHLAPGKVTIVDFYAAWCGPCKLVSPAIQELAQTDSEIVVRKIDIVNWESAVARQYNVTALPRIEIYGRKAQLVATVRGADPDQVRQYVAQAKAGEYANALFWRK